MLPRQQKNLYRFGIGEWFGRPFERLTPGERRENADLSLTRKKDGYPPCPFQSTPDKSVQCTKQGGVCTLRRYLRKAETGSVVPVQDESGALRTVCPYRFEEDGMIYRWVGETLLHSADPIVLKQIGFLEGIGQASRDVGRIDTVLLVPGTDPLDWCALEVQAVYFQGKGMNDDFEAIAGHLLTDLPFPTGNRRPDYRSSGPKRLMPQLQIKVPSLRRWGRKMAVVVDRDFFANLGYMEPVSDVSNCDIAWFVVEYDGSLGSPKLQPDGVHLTTLEAAVVGLTAGNPVSREVFELRIRQKLAELRRKA